MAWITRMGRLAASSAVLLSLAACGSPATPAVAPAAVRSAYVPESKSVPPASAFVVIKCEVIELLPDDNQGLPHQNFVVKDADGDELTVNHDTKYGEKVKGLKVGDKLEIKGVMYHGRAGDGIHWTHHANKDGDAGYIKRAGTIYE